MSDIIIIIILRIHTTKPTDHPSDEHVNRQCDYDVEDNLHCGYILHQDVRSVNHNFLFSTDRDV